MSEPRSAPGPRAGRRCAGHASQPGGRRAGDYVQDNLNPVGRSYYGFSTLLCTPASLSQEVGLALGTQAGPAGIRAVVAQGGFTRFAKVAETPFNQVLQVRR